QRLVDPQRQLQILEDPTSPGLQDERAAAIVAYDVLIVADENHRPIGALDEERVIALAMEPLVADSEHLIDQEAFEIDRQRQGEHQAPAHSRRIGLDRKIELAAELGEIVDEGEHVLFVAIVETSDEARGGGAR